MSDKCFDPFGVERGSKSFGYVRIIDSVATEIEMPVGVINGSSSGPTLAVTAGLFAHEYCGIEAACRLYQLIRPANLSGRVILVPIVNLPCLRFRTPWFKLTRSISPTDGANINALFPGQPGGPKASGVAYRQTATSGGDPSGLVTKIIAYRLFHDIMLKSDYHVDLRGGDLDESHMAHSIFVRVGQEIDETCEEMAKVFGHEYVFASTPQIGHSGEGTLIYEAVVRGVPSIISESGLGYRTQPLEEHISLHVEGVKNLLRHLRMIEGRPVRPRDQKFLDTTWHWIPVPEAGFFHAIVDQGDQVTMGQLLGRITDLDGSELYKITSPIDGIVHCMFPRRFVWPGDDVYTLLKVLEPTGW